MNRLFRYFFFVVVVGVYHSNNPIRFSSVLKKSYLLQCAGIFLGSYVIYCEINYFRHKIKLEKMVNERESFLNRLAFDPDYPTLDVDQWIKKNNDLKHMELLVNYTKNKALISGRLKNWLKK